MLQQKSIYLIITVTLLAIASVFWVVSFRSHTVEDSIVNSTLPQSDDSDTGYARKVIPTTVGIPTEEIIPFDTLLESKPSRAFQSVLDNIYLDTYGIYPCTVPGNDTNTVMLTAKFVAEGDDFTTTQSEAFIENWEIDAMQDIGYIIYPLKKIKKQPVIFSEVPDTTIRRAIVEIDDEESYMYSSWVLNFVFYASSFECLDQAIEMVYHTHSH